MFVTQMRSRLRGYGLMALAALSLAAPPALAFVTLHEHDDFRGRFTNVGLPTANLGTWSFNDLASSIVVHQGRWQFCEHADYAGSCFILGPGRYPSLNAMGMNDRISSVRPAPAGEGPAADTSIELFEHHRQGGRVFRAAKAVTNLQREFFNDVASSAVVRNGRWELCSDAEYAGRCIVIGPGTYPELADWGLNDAVSSVRPTVAPLTRAPSPPGSTTTEPAEGPEITFSSNRTARITFPHHACVVFFGRGGQRLQSLPQCDADQVSIADDLMLRFRSEYGMDRRDAGNPWASRPRPPAPPAAPAPYGVSIEITIGFNREGEVRFNNGCSVGYSAAGHRMKQSPSCTPEQLQRADEEMLNYRRAGGN